MLSAIRRGFDGLDVAFEAQISGKLSDLLEEAKLAAGDNKEPTLFEYGGVKMHVAESGAIGGYAFRCDAGYDGATWFFKKPNAKDKWGIRVSVKSLALALYGLGGVRVMIYDFFESLGIHVADGAESISRVDFCIDFLLPGFELVPENFVMHARMNRADHIESDKQVNGTSGRVSSVTVGKMPGRQIIVYDKRKEVIDKRKLYWWNIWNAGLQRSGQPLIDPNDIQGSQIWRVELRAGKKHLKDRWQVRTWTDLDEKLGDIFRHALSDIRYTVPIADQNRSRWPNHALWDAVANEIDGDLFEMMSDAEPSVIKEVIREEHRRLLDAQITGLAATCAVVMGVSSENAEQVPDIISDNLRRFDRNQPGELEKKMVRAEARYVFYEPESENQEIAIKTSQ